MSTSLHIKVNQLRFLGLSQLYENTDSEQSIIRCAYLVGEFNHCANRSRKKNRGLSNDALKKLYIVLCKDIQYSPDEENIEFNTILEELVECCLCTRRHLEMGEEARSQWLEELANSETRSQLRENLKVHFPKPMDLTTTPKRTTANVAHGVPSTPLSQTDSAFERYMSTKGAILDLVNLSQWNS
ncbi:hypothetical protein N7540_001759 [Penicillium herquei]|nr:hypothetical protein N7540_001759 [Penicillium herquei]